ncbi:MAG TPA: glycosyltransferase [Steroidobacteraceae bacterium]|nr:glycosyltransferase [Steroidobacteraceae bacterium]
MKILILNRDYPRFLNDLYASRPQLCTASYAEQLAVRNATLFGVADFYSRGFAACGNSAQEIHVNNRWLQSAWSRESGMHAPAPPPPQIAAARSALAPLVGLARRHLLSMARQFVPRQLQAQEERILAAQVASMKPDVILNQEMSYVRSACLERIVPPGTKIVGQIASALPVGEDYTRYDLIISSLPNLVRRFRDWGLRAQLSPLAFDARVLECLGTAAARDIPVSFVGSLSVDHRARLQLIETLAARVPLKLWGSGIEELPRSSPVHRCFQGEAWGIEMYRILARSRVTINHHIDLAEGYSNNMRLYEATGCGALMIVDHGRNLADLFEPGREVIAYSSAEECARAVQWMLSDEPRRAEIAAAGQRRTLSEHTYGRRARELSEMFAEL